MIVNERKINFLHLGLYSDSECGIIINVKSSTKKKIKKKKKKVEKNCIYVWTQIENVIQ